jgi:lipopolysaccharide export system permease protein
MAGFACSVVTARSPVAALIHYTMLVAAIGAGMWMIVAGVVVEPPPRLIEAINRSNARIARLFRRPAIA